MSLKATNKKKMDADVNIKIALSPNVVGYCVNILEDYLFENEKGNFKGFINYYINTKGTNGLLKATSLITDFGYSVTDAKKYVYQRVFKDTWDGKYWELKVKEELSLKGFKTRFSTTKEDYEYCIDLVGDKFAIQVKPISYYKGTNPSLMIDKKRHREAQCRYESISGKVVGYAFYDKHTKEIIYKIK